MTKARRRLAKIWHPDLAAPGSAHQHERHLKAINLAADRLQKIAEGSRGGRVTMTAIKVNEQAARAARAAEGERFYAQQAGSASGDSDIDDESVDDEQRAEHDPFGARVPDHSVVHRYARCLSYPEWGVGSVSGVYFTESSDGDTLQWARVAFEIGVRTVPAGTLEFVDFSKPDPGQKRKERFLLAAQHALFEGDFALAAQRLLHARNADGSDNSVLRLLVVAQLGAGEAVAAGRSARELVRQQPGNPLALRMLLRAYVQQQSWLQAREIAKKLIQIDAANPTDLHSMGLVHLKLFELKGAQAALTAAARLSQPVVAAIDIWLDLALACQLNGDLGAEVDACESALRITELATGATASTKARVLSRLAHALARTDRQTEAQQRCAEALQIWSDSVELKWLMELLSSRFQAQIPAPEREDLPL